MTTNDLSRPHPRAANGRRAAPEGGRTYLLSWACSQQTNRTSEKKFDKNEGKVGQRIVLVISDTLINLTPRLYWTPPSDNESVRVPLQQQSVFSFNPLHSPCEIQQIVCSWSSELSTFYKIFFCLCLLIYVIWRPVRDRHVGLDYSQLGDLLLI